MGAPVDATGTRMLATLTPVALALGGIALGSLVVLALALVLARYASRPRARKPTRRSFDGGRARTLSEPVISHAAAMARLRDGTLGTVLVQREARDEVVVEVRRRHGWPCERVAGGLAGLFESAWAADVEVEHESCGGRLRLSPCVYRVRRRPVQVSDAGRRAGAASTRGS